MASRHIELAVAHSFVHLFIIGGSLEQKLSSADIATACERWCVARRLYKPTFAELNKAMIDGGYLPTKSNGQRLWRAVCWRDDPSIIDELTDSGCLHQLTQQPVAIPLRIFNDLVRIGRSTFYAMEARGDTPRSYRLGSRVFIRAVDALEWCVDRGRHAAVVTIADYVERQRAEQVRPRETYARPRWL